MQSVSHLFSSIWGENGVWPLRRTVDFHVTSYGSIFWTMDIRYHEEADIFKSRMGPVPRPSWSKICGPLTKSPVNMELIENKAIIQNKISTNLDVDISPIWGVEALKDSPHLQHAITLRQRHFMSQVVILVFILISTIWKAVILSSLRMTVKLTLRGSHPKLD